MQSLSLALQVTAAAESCVRALATTDLEGNVVVETLANSTVSISKLQRVLLPNNSSEPEHALQLLREAQLPLLCSIIKAVPMSRAAGWDCVDSVQVLIESMDSLSEGNAFREGNTDGFLNACSTLSSIQHQQP
jgi:hypothetical protein